MLPTITRERTGSPVRFTRSLIPEFDSWFEDFLGRPMDTWSQWAPTVDLFETDDEYVLELDLPGFSREDIEITVEQGMLTVSGQRPEHERNGNVTYHVRERTTARFSRSFSLPRGVDTDDVKAEFSDGVLTVNLPKVADAKPRRIEVKVK